LLNDEVLDPLRPLFPLEHVAVGIRFSLGIAYAVRLHVALRLLQSIKHCSAGEGLIFFSSCPTCLFVVSSKRDIEAPLSRKPIVKWDIFAFLIPPTVSREARKSSQRWRMWPTCF
jgi:hypothetical protein